MLSRLRTAGPRIVRCWARPRLCRLALATVFLLSAANAQEPQPGQGSSRPGPDRQQNPAAIRPVFEFHSSFWINLHHFLYQQARIRAQEPTRRGGASTPAEPPPTVETPVDAAASTEWEAALNYYAKNLAERDLLFDGDMVNINNRLAELESCADLSGRTSPDCAAGLRPEIVSALERAAPIYRSRWWAQHDRLNRAWIAAVAPLVRQMGGPLADQLSEVYHAEWGREPLRVDVVFYGGPFGAYTTQEPTHITISSTDERNQGFAGFEILFHEASHALDSAVREGIARECRARNKPIPRDLWHALLFYTTGEIVKRALKRSNLSPGPAPSPAGTYTPYAYRYGLYARGWQDYQRVLERYWQPYLDGRTGFDQALASLVAAL